MPPLRPKRRSPLRLVAAACAAAFVAVRLIVTAFSDASGTPEIGLAMVVPYALGVGALGWIAAWAIERFAATITTRRPFEWLGPIWSTVLVVLAGAAGAGLAKIELADSHERLRPRVIDTDASVSRTPGWEAAGCGRLVAARVVCEAVKRAEAPAPLAWNGQAMAVDCAGPVLTVSRAGSPVARVPLVGDRVVDVLAVELPIGTAPAHVALLARMPVQDARDLLVIVDASGVSRHRELVAVSGLPMRERLSLCETEAGERRLLLDTGQASTYHWR
jgi:hypothetical protein